MCRRVAQARSASTASTAASSAAPAAIRVICQPGHAAGDDGVDLHRRVPGTVGDQHRPDHVPKRQRRVLVPAGWNRRRLARGECSWCGRCERHQGAGQPGQHHGDAADARDEIHDASLSMWVVVCHCQRAQAAPRAAIRRSADAQAAARLVALPARKRPRASGAPPGLITVSWTGCGCVGGTSAGVCGGQAGWRPGRLRCLLFPAAARVLPAERPPAWVSSAHGGHPR